MAKMTSSKDETKDTRATLDSIRQMIIQRNTKWSRIVARIPTWECVAQALTIAFPFTNNQTKYDTCIVGLEIAADMEVQMLKVFSDSKLMINQMNEEYQVKEPIMQKYIDKVKVIKEKIKKLKFIYILREKNARVNLFSKLSSIEEHVGMENVVYQILHILKFFMMRDTQEIWLTLILEYIQNGVILKEQKERRKL